MTQTTPEGLGTGVGEARATAAGMVGLEPGGIERQRLLATLLGNLSGVAYRCRNDAAWTMEFVSEGCYQLTGYVAEDLIDNRRVSFGGLIRATDRLRLWAEVQQALAVPQPFELSYGIVTATGEEKWVSERGQGVYDAAGALCAIEGVIIDVTRLRRVEIELAKKEQMLRAILDQSLGFIGLLDTEGRMLRANTTALRLVEARMEDVVGRLFWETPWWREAPAEQVKLREGIARAARGEFVRFETVHRPEGKPEVVVDFALSPVRDEQGQVVGMIPEGHDITELKAVERALRESQEKFAKAFHACPQSIAISELETGRMIEVNRGFERIFGFARDEVIGRTSVELGIWRDRNERQRIAERLKREGRVQEIEVDFLRCDGRPVDGILTTELVEIGGRRFVLGIISDVTVQKEAERALRDSEAKFATAFRASPHALTISDWATGRYIDVNTGFERLAGYRREEVIGRTSFELGLWIDPTKRSELIRRLETEGSVREMELGFYGRDRRVVLTLCSCERMELGGVPCLLNTIEDITEQRRAEGALRESEEKFEKAFRVSPQAMSISQLESGRYLDVNAAFERVLGHSRADLIGRTSVEVGIWERPDDRLDLVRRYRAGEPVREIEINLRTRDGRSIITLCSAEPIEIDGVPHALSTIQDITSQRRAEQEKVRLEAQLRQAQKLEALGQLAGGIAHDFNNILTGIMAYTELAEMDAHDPDAVRSHLGEVHRASKRAGELVRQILTFSRQQQKQQRRPILIETTVHEALRLLRSSLPATIEIVAEIDPATPPVLADATQIHQVIMNLGTNAAHAMRERGGRLGIALRPEVLPCTRAGAPARLPAGRYARLTVSDTGHGMDEDTLARVFEPFFTTKGPGEGTGLGLAVVHGIMDSHDGAITVSSRPGEGTAFELYFPQHIEMVVDPSEHEDPLPRGHGEKILLVDDEQMICHAAGELLERLDYEVTMHTDPREALGLMRLGTERFALLITDLTMPHLTGIELARRARDLCPGLPVILTSGQSNLWTPESVRVLGIRAIVAKPLSSGSLARAVRTVLDAVRPVPPAR